MAPKLQFDPVPQPMAGVMSVRCSECGWEMVFIMPEEQIILISTIFTHLREVHKIETPQLCCTWH